MSEACVTSRELVWSVIKIMHIYLKYVGSAAAAALD